MEHMTPKGLRQGYFCAVCGESCNLYATGHGMGKCQPNPERVKVLQELNSNGAGNSLPKEPTPTPSITVGTQVRLTGVVEPDPAEGGGGIYLRTAGGHSVYLNSSAKEDLEVIRQPFKRGEVVWHGTTELSVLADEEANTVLLVEPMAGAVAFGADANLFERRP